MLRGRHRSVEMSVVYFCLTFYIEGSWLIQGDFSRLREESDYCYVKALL